MLNRRAKFRNLFATRPLTRFKNALRPVESHGGDGIDRATVQDKATCPDCWYVFGTLGIYPPKKPIKKLMNNAQSR